MLLPVPRGVPSPTHLSRPPRIACQLSKGETGVRDCHGATGNDSHRKPSRRRSASRPSAAPGANHHASSPPCIEDTDGVVGARPEELPFRGPRIGLQSDARGRSPAAAASQYERRRCSPAGADLPAHRLQSRERDLPTPAWASLAQHPSSQLPARLSSRPSALSPAAPRARPVTPATHECRAERTAACSGDETVAGVRFQWTRGGNLGHGSFGNVFKAQIASSGAVIAVKEAVIDVRDRAERKYRDVLRRELEICQDLKHPNIVRCLGHDCIDECLYVYLEYIAGGTLRQRLNEYGPPSQAVLKKAFRGLVTGLHYLHSHDPPVVHRDLKGANVLVDGVFRVKLADFGCSKRSSSTMSFSTVGSVHWIAPEVVRSEGHGRSADIWSLGCVLVEMATADDPWGRDAFDNRLQAMRDIGWSARTPRVPTALAPLGQELAARCLQRAASDRPTAVELLAHAFVARRRRDPGRSSTRHSLEEPSLVLLT